MSNIVTRFAPSPTGYLHIGGARTALYAYLWAKKHKGTFLLRIEDTDQARYKADAEDSILDGLRWIGIDWEGDIIHQSDRTEIYREHAQKLITDEKAYYCFCTTERLDTMREIQRKKGRAPKYDKTCLRLTSTEIQSKLDADESHVVRLNVPEEGSVTVRDLVRGNITIQCSEIDDQILLKSDNFPTYHLANVVDDHASDITHVIRGEEWIPSTPKHVLLYQAFGWEPPEFAHLSLFINKGGGKLSKRQGALSLLEYKTMGYLPEAIVNFIAFLGWNPKSEQEMFTMEELIEQFELSNINTANPIFDTDKLDWYNGQYIRKLSLTELTDYCRPYLPSATDEDYLQSVVALEQDRLKKFSDITELTSFFFQENLDYTPELLVWKKNTREQTKLNLEQLMEECSRLDTWAKESLEQHLLQWIKDNGFGNGDILWPMRAALTGKQASPPPFDVAAVLGKERSLERLQKAISVL